MSRRDNADKRCDTCAMHLGLCICSQIPDLATQSRLCLVLHFKEARKTTNTGSLACLALRESERVIHGVEGVATRQPWSVAGKSRAYRNLLLYPADEAEPLRAEHASQGPVRLVVPDGNWRQAGKMTRRIDWMASLPRVGLPAGQRTSYLLRFEPKMEGLATMEAIARAFGILEGKEIEEKLEEVFRIMVDRTLYSRGKISRAEVHGGVPADFVRHEPTSR